MFERSHTHTHEYPLIHVYSPPSLYKTPGKFANNKLSQSQANIAKDEKLEFLWICRCQMRATMCMVFIPIPTLPFILLIDYCG